MAIDRPAWQPEPINISGVTDCYQPCERQFRLTRACLEVLAEYRNPVGIVTKIFQSLNSNLVRSISEARNARIF